MGLMDVLNGMQNGPRGPSEPGGGGMSPITMAILGLLAYKAVKKIGTDHASASHTAGADMSPPSMPGASGAGGGFGNLGGLLTGGAAGSILSGGLGDLIKHFQNAGHGDAANSWVGSGPNQPIAPKTLESALGGERIDDLTQQTGLSKDDLLKGLSQYLPEAIDHLTPNGRVPDAGEMSKHL